MGKLVKLATICLMLSSCGDDNLDYFEGRHGTWTPRPMYFGVMPEGGDSYSQGMRDGCNSSLSTISQGFQKSNYKDIYLDVNRTIEDDEYNKGWSLGNNYCAYYNDTDVI